MRDTTKINFLRRPPWRTIIPGVTFLLIIVVGYLLWSPGLDIRDGRHDKEQNALWVSHGWLGGDDWFIRNGKTNETANFRDPAQIQKLATKLHAYHITDIFPHLCPSEPDGSLPAVDSNQVERFLDEMAGLRVMPWVGGPNGGNVRLNNAKWRAAFINNIRTLLESHPRFAGIHLNVEPLTSGDTNFLQFLEEIRNGIPRGKLLSIAAYPPPTWWQKAEDVHWDEAYFRAVARHADQMVVMMYDVGQRIPKTYVKLMADWTPEALAWSEGKQVLLGVPAYKDTGVDYHDAKIENLRNALLGIHRGLSRQSLPANYQGVAIYSEWEMDTQDWQSLQDRFLKAPEPYM
jgi:hypothetical protein